MTQTWGVLSSLKRLRQWANAHLTAAPSLAVCLQERVDPAVELRQELPANTFAVRVDGEQVGRAARALVAHDPGRDAQLAQAREHQPGHDLQGTLARE